MDRRDGRPVRPGGARVTGADLAAGSMHAIGPVLADALARPDGPARADRRSTRVTGPDRDRAAGAVRRDRPVRHPTWSPARRATAALGWAWVVVPFGWGLYELVAKIPALFG